MKFIARIPSIRFFSRWDSVQYTLRRLHGDSLKFKRTLGPSSWRAACGSLRVDLEARGWTESEYARVRLLHRRSPFLQLGILEFIDVQARAPMFKAYGL